MSASNLKVALTGGIASGKSQVSKLLEQHGNSIVDLDILAREVVKPGTDGLKELVAAFSEDILNDDGTLNRAYLRDKLYRKGRNRALIEDILHPKISEKMHLAMDAHKNGVMVVVVPLLVEKSLWQPFNRAIVVDTTIEKQLERLKTRENIDQDKAEAMLLAQASREQRLKLGEKLPTDVIENNSEIFDLDDKVASLHQKLTNLL